MNSMQQFKHLPVWHCLALSLATIFFTFCNASGQQESVQHWLPEFISQLDPGSDIARQITQIDSEPEQIRVLASHFRQQAHLQPLWIIPFPDQRDPKHDTAKADNAVNGLIWTMYGSQHLSSPLPWFDPDKKVRTLARFPHFDYLAPAYFHTQNEKYARLMVQHIEDFIANAPIEEAANMTVQTEYTVNPWNWVLLLWRISRWIDALTYLQTSPSMSDAGYLQTLNHLWKEVDWLVPRMYLGLHNGTLGNIRAVLYAGLNFPEAKNSALWLQEGLSTFKGFLNGYFYPGEVSVELTLGYSASVLGQCLTILAGLPEGAGAGLKEPLARLVDGHFGLMKPDRSLPRYGDHGAYDIRPLFLQQAIRVFDRKDWQQVAAGQDEIIDPAFLSWPAQSRPYYLSGYYAMRDGWGADAQYLSIDSGPFGTNHQHSDKLSITLSAESADFIVDPGTSIYNSTESGPRYDLRFGFLHNVITIDGIDPNAGWDMHYQFDAQQNHWITNPVFDFVSGEYDFRANMLDAIWRRSVYYRRGEYWIIADRLAGGGEREIESNFQFSIGMQVEPSGRTVRATAPNQAQLVVYATDEILQPRVVTGDTSFPGTTHPIREPNIDHIAGGRGWVGTFGNFTPLNPHHSHPAPALVYAGTAELPFSTARVLVPSRDKKVRPMHVSQIINSQQQLRIKIEHSGELQGTIDIWDMQLTDMPPLYEHWQKDSNFWLRLFNQNIREIALVNRRELVFENTLASVRIAFSEPVAATISKKESGWRIDIDSFVEHPVKLLAARLKGPETDIDFAANASSNAALFDDTGARIDELFPGQTYWLR